MLISGRFKAERTDGETRRKKKRKSERRLAASDSGDYKATYRHADGTYQPRTAEGLICIIIGPQEPLKEARRRREREGEGKGGGGGGGGSTGYTRRSFVWSLLTI